MFISNIKLLLKQKPKGFEIGKFNTKIVQGLTKVFNGGLHPTGARNNRDEQITKKTNTPNPIYRNFLNKPLGFLYKRLNDKH